MNLQKDQCYHLYNRSNRGHKAFFEISDYERFLSKVKNEWLHHFNILSYCLMPTHFHFIIHTKFEIIFPKANYAVGKLLSSYSRYINIKQESHGSIFQRTTKAKPLIYDPAVNYSGNNYIGTCFDYIHNNPIKDGLVKDLNKWKYSSYQVYSGLIENSICDIERAEKLIGFKCGKDFISRYC